MLHPDAKPRSTAKVVSLIECCQPACSALAQDLVVCEVPLCEMHFMHTYKASHRLLVAKNRRGEEYALLPSEQQQMPGPCPACGLCGYLAVTVTDQVRCLNASCRYEAWVDDFERLRRDLLFLEAGDQEVVYYAKYRDRVKIGTTTNLRQRMSQIVTVELLYGYEPGGLPVERRRHRQFADLRTTVGEWFKDDVRIRAHVNNVCSIAA